MEKYSPRPIPGCEVRADAASRELLRASRLNRSHQAPSTSVGIL